MTEPLSDRGKPPVEKSEETKESAPNSPAAKTTAIQVKWELNFGVVLSLIALLVSLVLAGYNLSGWLIGAQITPYAPQLVSFHCTSVHSAADGSDECDDNSSLFLVATSMTYVNKGQPAYGAVLLLEEATVSVGSKSFKLSWQYFSKLTTSSDAVPDNAAALVIPGASAVSHETQFFPRDDACQNPCNIRAAFFPWKEFVAAITQPDTLVSIDFKSTVLRPEQITLEQECDVLFQDRDRADFQAQQMKKTRITSLTCRVT